MRENAIDIIEGMEQNKGHFGGASMEKNEFLTNESIRKKFKSQFELVNYAIKLSEQMIHSGRPPMIDTESENTAVIIVEEINEGKDIFDEHILVSKEIITEPESLKNGADVAPAPVKATEKKKTRRILA